MFASISNRFNTFLLLLLVLMAASIIAILATRSSAGPLDPPGPPASTAPLVEPRTPIRQPATAAGFPIVISAPGSYYLAENITGVSGKDGIDISANGVTLDLNGFVLAGVPGSGNGISGTTAANTNVHGGTVRSWDGTGIFGDFITFGTYEDLRLTSNGGGIRAGGASLISHVVAVNNAQHGILMVNYLYDGGIIRDSISSDNGLDGIQVLGRVLVVENTSLNNYGSQIHVYNSGSRIDSNNVETRFAGGSLAIKVEASNNVIIRNSIRGAIPDVVTVAGNTFGPLESAGTPIGNPWANIVY
jgi:hypothetical protein